MPKKERWEAVLALVTEDGLSLEHLMGRLEFPIEKRTLQRRLKDLFLWAHERSAMRYSAIHQPLGEPDAFRSNYWEEPREAIQQVVVNALGKDRAIPNIKIKARNVVSRDRAQFAKAVERELLDLHEGNFARFKIAPSEFNRWKTIWEN